MILRIRRVVIFIDLGDTGMKTAKDIMSSNLLTTPISVTLEKVHQLMVEKQTHHIIITDNNQRLIPIVTMVNTDATGFVKPSEYFKPMAQQHSNRPAITR